MPIVGGEASGNAIVEVAVLDITDANNYVGIFTLINNKSISV